MTSITNPTIKKLKESKGGKDLDECSFYREPDKAALKQLDVLAKRRPIHFSFGMDAGGWTDLHWLSDLPNCQFVSILNNNYSQPRTVDLRALTGLGRLVLFEASTFESGKKIDFEPVLASAQTLEALSVDAKASKTNLKLVLPKLEQLRCLALAGLDGKWTTSLANLRFLRVNGKIKNADAIGPTVRHLLVFDGEIPELDAGTWKRIEVLELFGNIKRVPTALSCPKLKYVEINAKSIVSLQLLRECTKLRTLVIHDWRGDSNEISELAASLPSLKEIWVTFHPVATNAVKGEELKKMLLRKSKVRLLTEHPGNYSHTRWIDSKLPNCLR